MDSISRQRATGVQWLSSHSQECRMREKNCREKSRPCLAFRAPGVQWLSSRSQVAQRTLSQNAELNPKGRFAYFCVLCACALSVSGGGARQGCLGVRFHELGFEGSNRVALKYCRISGLGSRRPLRRATRSPLEAPQELHDSVRSLLPPCQGLGRRLEDSIPARAVSLREIINIICFSFFLVSSNLLKAMV